VTLPVGLGVSDVQAVDTRGDGSLDLVVTNKLTGQVSVLHNWGDGSFAAPLPYRAGTGLSAVDPSNTPEVTSLEATTGVAAGPLTTGGPTDLVTINPGSNTMDILAGLGGGRFANPIALQTKSPAQVIRLADFNHDGIPDLAVLSDKGVSIYLGNGQGGFAPPVTYDAGPDPSGLTVADVNRDGNLDLLIGNAYGDVLVLLGQGDGKFQPYHEANQAVELAVADLTGTGSKDIIYADQSLDRVVVDYGAGNSAVLANQSMGLLDPGAVALADLNGDGIKDLIVANSGSNNVMIYPGLGNGQFGPVVNGGHGYFVGTNPVGITVAKLTGDLPDLVVADKGSNQVSILVNQGNFDFTAGPRLNAGGTGPVSTIVRDFNGDGIPDILVTNSGSNDVRLLPGVGGGFFNDTNPQTFVVGTDPVASFVGTFNGQTDLVTINAGSNDLTLISGFEGPDPVTRTIASGGTDPTTALAFDGGNGFEDLVVGNTGDGVLALFEGGPEGLSLAAATSEPNLPEPTALALAALSGGQVQFYAATAGRESAELVALSLGIETEAASPLAAAAPTSPVFQLVALNETSLPLVATVLTLTVPVPGAEFSLGPAEFEAATVASFLPGAGISVGQGLAPTSRGGGPSGDEAVAAEEPGAAATEAVPGAISAWERMVIGLDEALEQFRRANPGGLSGAMESSPAGDRPQAAPAPSPSQPASAPGAPTGTRSEPDRPPSGGEANYEKGPSPTDRSAAVDTAIEALGAEDRADDSRGQQFPASVWGADAPLDRTAGAPTVAVILKIPIGSARATPGQAVPAPGQDEPGLAGVVWVLAAMAVQWAQDRHSSWKPLFTSTRRGPRSARRRARPLPVPAPGGRICARTRRRPRPA
jgi:hypothetical protein